MSCPCDRGRPLGRSLTWLCTESSCLRERLDGGGCKVDPYGNGGSIRLHKAPACALRASLCSPSPTHRGQLDTRAFSAKRKIELLVARFLRAGGSRRKSWDDARCCSGGERLAIGTMYPGGIPGPGLIFDACVLVVVRRCRGVRCSTCATTCTPSPFVVSLSKWVSRSGVLC